MNKMGCTCGMEELFGKSPYHKCYETNIQSKKCHVCKNKDCTKYGEWYFCNDHYFYFITVFTEYIFIPMKCPTPGCNNIGTLKYGQTIGCYNHCKHKYRVNIKLCDKNCRNIAILVNSRGRKYCYYCACKYILKMWKRDNNA